ncbi:MAG: hypothetical protein ACFB0C_06705 [Leptolyngbyaceae cyanobacterium]
MPEPVENLAIPESEAPEVFDFSDTITAIMILFMELSWLDPMWGDNHGADTDIPAHFDGWNHPVLLRWAAERGYFPPLQHNLDGPGLYVLQRSLENKLEQLKREVLTDG